MSIHVMNQVWRRAQYTGGELLVLLALADWADDDGKCFPSLVSVAAKARLSKRQVCRLIAKFREDGVLSGVPGKGRGHRTQYQINSDKMSPFPAPKKSVAGVTQLQKEKVTSATVKGDICDIPPAPPNRKNHQEPSKKQIHTAPLQAAVEIRKGESKAKDKAWCDGWNGVLSDLHRALVVNRPKAVQDRLGGHDDWQLYFAEMACGGVDRRGGTAGRLILQVPNAKTAQQGMVKYHKRIHAGMKKYFGREVQVMLVDSS